MINCRVNGLNIFDPIDGKLDQIIEYLVKFYGEEYRQRITDRINNTTFLFVGEIDEQTKLSTFTDLKKYYYKQLNNIKKAFFEELGMPNNPKIEILDVDRFHLFAMTIESLRRNELDRLDGKKIYNLIKFLDIMGVKNSENQKLRSLKDLQELVQNDEKYIEVLDIYLKAKKLWTAKYSRKYFETTMEKKLNESKISTFEEKSREIIDYYKGQINNLFLSVISRVKNVDVETLKANDKIHDYIQTFIDIVEKRNELITNYDKKNRIALYKFMGIDHGDDYEAYKNDPFIIKLTKAPELLEKYREYTDNQLNELVIRCNYLTSAYESLENNGVNITKDGLARAIFKTIMGKNSSLAWAFSLSYSGKKELQSICVCKNALKLDTLTLIHEINHILEFDYLFKNGEFAGYKSGFTYRDSKSVAQNDVEILDEVINDYIAYQIYDEFKRDGFELGYKEPITSEYSKMFLVIGEFLEENLELIKKCRMSSNPNMFAQIIGLNNFEMLNNAIKKCYTLDYYEVFEANKEINEKAENNFSEPLSKNAKLLYETLQEVDKVTANVRQKLNFELIK